MFARSRRRRLSASSDDRLVELVIDGDDTAFELLYTRHVVDALAFANRMLGSREDAEEAVRHSFAAVRAYLADGGSQTAFAPWLYTILDNHCLSVLQRRRRYPERDGTVVELDQHRRRRRKLLGGVLPIPPSAGFHDSVLTACGVGAAPASAEAPLLGGTLAKLAVVALLASGTGVATDAVTDRDRGAVDVPVAQAPLIRTLDAGGAWPLGEATWSRARPDDPDRWSLAPVRWTAPGLGGPLGDVPYAVVDEPVVAPPADALTDRPSNDQEVGLGDAPVPGLAPPTDEDPRVEVPPPTPVQGEPELGERVKAELPSPAEPAPAPIEPPENDLPSAAVPPQVDPPVVEPLKVEPQPSEPQALGGVTEGGG